MKTLILSLLISLTTISVKAESIKFELMQGFATHYTEFDGYNDSVFKDNLTSTVSLARISYKSYSVLGLSDSQGDLSFALTKEFELVKRSRFDVKAIMGVYILRNDYGSKIFAPEVDSILPRIQVGARSWSVMPLAGIQVDYNLTDNLDLSLVVTPTFTLWGVKIGF